MNDAFDLNELARRYLDLWQQHLLQTAKDPDLTADLATIMEVMPSLFFSASPKMTETPIDETTQRATTTATTSDGRNGDIDELRHRLAVVEERLVALENNLAEQGNALQKELKEVNPEEFADELATELLSRTNKFLQGIETYRSHSFTRDLTSPASIWQSGSVQLLDYGETDPTGRNGRPVLIIPSLINRSYIMDLTAECSFLRYLASQGLRPLLVDWGQPDKKSLAQTLDDCVAKTLRNALNFAVDLFMQKPVPIIGYCMGGTLATALSVLEPENVMHWFCSPRHGTSTLAIAT